MSGQAGRLVLLGAVALAAMPAYAHGAGLLVIGLAVLWGVPAALALFVPWHTGRIRLAVALIPVAVGAAAFAFVLSVVSRTGDSTFPGASVVSAMIYGPPVIIVLAATVLYVMRRRAHSAGRA